MKKRRKVWSKHEQLKDGETRASTSSLSGSLMEAMAMGNTMHINIFDNPLFLPAREGRHVERRRRRKMGEVIAGTKLDVDRIHGPAAMAGAKNGGC